MQIIDGVSVWRKFDSRWVEGPLFSIPKASAISTPTVSSSSVCFFSYVVFFAFFYLFVFIDFIFYIFCAKQNQCFKYYFIFCYCFICCQPTPARTDHAFRSPFCLPHLPTLPGLLAQWHVELFFIAHVNIFKCLFYVVLRNCSVFIYALEIPCILFVKCFLKRSRLGSLGGILTLGEYV